MTSPPCPLTTTVLREQVQVHVQQFVAEQAMQLHQISPLLDPLAQAIHTLIATGKRLRPAFAVWGWWAVASPTQREQREQVIAACASLELLQACALIHDDVMDASDLRRGQPTVHRQVEQLHRRQGWQGDAANFGRAGAILLGDLALGWTDQMYFSSGVEPQTLLRAKPALDAMRLQVSAGQYLDVVAQASGETDQAALERVLDYKSARYTVQGPLQLGGLLADAPQPVLAAYATYGQAVGRAFQLRDDLLGVFGDPIITGKPAGDDLREGKRTLLIAYALTHATPTHQKEVHHALGQPDLDAGQVELLREILIQTGAVRHVEHLIATLRQQALTTLAQLAPLDPHAHQALEELALAATQREH